MGIERVGLVGVGAARDHESVAVAVGEAEERLEQLGVALLGDEPADGADHHGVVVGAERGAQRAALRRGEARLVEAGEVDAVAEQLGAAG